MATAAGFFAELTQEALAQVATRFGFDFLSRFGNKGAEAATTVAVERTTSPAIDDQEDDHLDYHIILNSDEFISLDKRKILREAINKLEPLEDQDRAERLIGKIITQGRDGFFKERPVAGMKVTKETSAETNTEVRKDGSQKDHKKETAKTIKDPSTTNRTVYPKGLTPEELLKNFLAGATADEEAAKIFLDGLLQQTRTQRALKAAEDAAKKAKAEIKRFGEYAIWLFAGYLLVLLILFVGWVSCFVIATVIAGDFIVSLVGLLLFGIFAALATPLVNLLLPKEGA